MSADADICLRLSAQRALLTHVTPTLRSVSADIDEARREVHLRFIFDGEPSPSYLEAAWYAATEVIADYPDGWRLDDEYVAVPAPGRMEQLRLRIYARCEDDWAGPDR